MRHLTLLSRLARPATTRIVLLVLDGAGDLRTAAQPRTALELARLPHLDSLATRGALGRLTPLAPGVTVGSGPGHLALFGYDPATPEADIGRGVLEALGLGLRLRPGEVAARGNFATAGADGALTDRRAGRIPTEECRRLCATIQARLEPEPDLEAEIAPGEAHRFVLILRGPDLSPALADTDPQETGVPPLEPRALEPAAASTAARLERLIRRIEAILADEPKANRVLLRGFSELPSLPTLEELYGLRCGAFAGYPLYRGVAAACGMEVVPVPQDLPGILDAVAEHWDRFDFFFLHVKKTDMAGEDGNLDAKVHVLEAVDAALPRLLELAPDVIAVTADHSTPAPLRGHSWHPVPVLVTARHCFVDDCREFTEPAALHGALGTFPARELMGLLLAHAGRLAKFGA